METRHTPTPWHSGKYSMQCGAAADHIYSRQSREPSEGIARCYAWVGRGEAEANAAFIVRACNAHDELVVALKQALDRMEKLQAYRNENPQVSICAVSSAINQAQVAIAKAEGRQHG